MTAGRGRDPAPCAPAGGRRFVLSEFTGCTRCSAARCVRRRRDPDDRRGDPEGTRRAPCRVRVLGCHRGERLRPDPPCTIDDPSGRPARAEPPCVRARARRSECRRVPDAARNRADRRRRSRYSLSNCRACGSTTEPMPLEHSLEVQLPFLQSVLDDFALLPFSVGDATADGGRRRARDVLGWARDAGRDQHRPVPLPPLRRRRAARCAHGRGHRRLPTGRRRRPRCVRCVPAAWAAAGRRRVRVRRRATRSPQLRRHRR